MTRNWKRELRRRWIAQHEVDLMCERFNFECKSTVSYRLTKEELSKANSYDSLNEIIERKKYEC